MSNSEKLCWKMQRFLIQSRSLGYTKLRVPAFRTDVLWLGRNDGMSLLCHMDVPEWMCGQRLDIDDVLECDEKLHGEAGDD